MSALIKVHADLLRRILAVFLSILLFAVAASACSGPATNAVAPLPDTSTPAPSDTPIPTTQPSPTATLTITATPTATETAAPTATATAAASPTSEIGWDQARFNSATNQTGGVQLSFIVPNLTTAYGMVLGGQTYSCQVDEKYPGLLFCWGLTVPPVNTPLTMAFTDPASGQVVYQGQTVVTSIVPPGNWVSNESTCSAAGQTQTCEMECRIDPTNGQPCIVASCFDMCGPTNFIQTCSNDVKNFTMCDGETQAKMKKQYNLP